MKVELLLERENEFRFGTTRSPIGPYRFLQITVCGRTFSTWYKLDDVRSSWDESYMKVIDDQLGKQFQRMAEKIVKAAFAMVPEGVEIAEMSDKQLQSLLRSGPLTDPETKTAKSHEL